MNQDASAEEVKRAYRRLAHRYHPDKNPEAPEAQARFSEAQEAYAVLSDPERRERYDRLGRTTAAPAAAPASRFSEGLEQLVQGLAGRRPRPEPGEDLRLTLEIDLDEAIRGAEKELRIPREGPCPHCGGTGIPPGVTPPQCRACAGRGQLRLRQGMLEVPRTCPACEGRGVLLTDPCDRCAGTGEVTSEDPLRLRIPAGLTDGQRLRLAGEGRPGRHGGPAGDLFVVIAVRPHTLLERTGQDLTCTVVVPLHVAALGGTVEIPTLEGRTTLEVPPGTQPGARFRQAGLGLRGAAGAPAGDLVITIAVETPVELSADQRELLAEFARRGDRAQYPQHQQFLTRLHSHPAGEVGDEDDA